MDTKGRGKIMFHFTLDLTEITISFSAICFDCKTRDCIAYDYKLRSENLANTFHFMASSHAVSKFSLTHFANLLCQPKLFYFLNDSRTLIWSFIAFSVILIVII